MLHGFRNRGTLFVIAAGVFWGSMGLFVRRLTALEFTSLQIVCMRLTVAAVLFGLILWRKNPSGLWISRKDIPLFLGLGLCSILFFTCCYFTAIQMMSMSVAAILLYTSPVWVMLMSALFFGEGITGIKVAALILSVLGCALVSGMGSDTGQITPVGLLIGLGAGFGYGLYSILGNVALRKYSPYTVTTYTFLIAAAGSWAVCQPGRMIEKAAAVEHIPALLVLIVVTGLVTAVVPFLLYTLGLQEIEPGRAAIFATIEPIVATILGAVVYGEKITVLSAVGICCVVGGILILNRPEDKQASQTGVPKDC